MGSFGGVTGLPQAVAFQRTPVSTLIEAQRAGGEVFPLQTLVGRMWVVATPDLADEVLRAPPGRYRAGSANRRILPVLPADTVLTLDGGQHRVRRRLLSPLFHGESLTAIAPVVRDIAAAEIARWPTGVPFATLPRTRFMTLRIVTRLLLGLDHRAQAAELEGHLRRALHPYAMLAGIDRFRRLGALSPQAAARRRRAGFALGLSQVCEAGGARRRHGRPDALELLGLPAGTAPGADHAEVADELFALLLAGQETAATALAWALEMLAHDPAATAALAAETEADGEHHELLDSAISEILRLRPPLVDIVRELAEPVRLGDRRLAAGTTVLIAPPLIHRCEHRDADSFIADRFLRRRPDPRTWLPFGGGDRRCLGASLALLELREILTHVVRNFTLEPAGGPREDARLHGTALVPASGGRVALWPR